MPRSPRIFTDQFPYHVTARCHNREWFKIPLEQVWDIFGRHLFFVHYGFCARIHSFVLMDNHFHLLISTPLANLDQVMQYLMREVSREVGQVAGRINQTFGGPYFSCVVKSHHYFLHAYKYVYRNPVQAGAIKRAEEYSFSTLNALLGFSRIAFPVEYDETLFNDVCGTLDWINTDYRNSHYKDVQKALRRGEFTLPRNESNKSPNQLEEEIS